MKNGLFEKLLKDQESPRLAGSSAGQGCINLKMTFDLKVNWFKLRCRMTILNQ
jgi:hypothetical protein